MSLGRLPIFLFLCLFWLLPAAAQDDSAFLSQIKERELETVRMRISELKQRMDESAAERDRITAELQQAEMLISENRIYLKELERQRAFSEKQKAALELEITGREADLEHEAAMLASQVRAAYLSGDQERIKLLLNQDDPATLGRLLVYYRYFSEFRGRNIESVTSRIAELDALRREVAAEESRLSALAERRREELEKLDAAQEERQQLLVALRARMREEGNEIERLAAEEEDLTRLIAELSRILSDYPITSEAPFSELKGRLTWPLAGTLIRDFGQPRAGGLKWNGVVLTAPRGREVRAVYHGRVVFADWLAGMGLLVIVDHGEGYMTLYGYNETILKAVGDWVAPGDVIATVGDSGGQSEVGLYFEIRRAGSPVNPGGWISRSPRTG